MMPVKGLLLCFHPWAVMWMTWAALWSSSTATIVRGFGPRSWVHLRLTLPLCLLCVCVLCLSCQWICPQTSWVPRSLPLLAKPWTHHPQLLCWE